METKKGTTKDRMAEVLQVLGVSAFEFETKCGLAHGFVARVSREITKKTRSKIKAVYPKLNINYIALGTGDMFLTEGQTEVSIKDRIMQFYESMELRRGEFTKKTGLSVAFVQNMSDNVRKDSLEKIYRAFPLLNPEWVEYGHGDMLLDKPKRRTTETASERIDRLIEFLGLTLSLFRKETGLTSISTNITKRTVDKIVRRYPFVNPLWLMHGTGKMISEPAKPVRQSFSYAPLVSQRAFAGYLNGFADDEYIDSLDKVPYVEDSEMKGNVIAIEVSGDSMDDGTAECYRDGDIVLAKEISTTDPLPISRYDFVIVHQTGILIKRIIKADKDSGILTIHSLNDTYGDSHLNMSDILKLFIVMMRISKQKH